MLYCRVKFGAFYEHLEGRFGGRFDRIGSGHYARLVRGPGGEPGGQVRLAMTPDAVKDQTYFLAHLSQQQLARTIFPLGALTKVRIQFLYSPYATVLAGSQLCLMQTRDTVQAA